jgi:hypothetical protein
VGGDPLNALEIEEPKSYQVFQRDGSNLAGIPIQGYVRQVGTYTIEASWNGGAYTDLVASATYPGAFRAALANQTAGQGTLIVRLKGTAYQDTVNYIGIGDIFMIAGQSNAVGSYTNAQSYSHATLKAGLFKNSYQWHELADHTDDATGAIDVISANAPSYAGSAWPVLATHYLADMGIPCAFVPCAAGGVVINSWLPGADHMDRLTFYGSMNYKRAWVGGCKAVLWHQGETDADNGLTQADYNTRLDTLANAIASDMSVPLIAVRLQQFPAATTEQIAAINAAINEAIGDNANVKAGPDLSDLDTTPDSFHFKTDEQAAIVAGRWWAAIKTAFGW